MLVIHPRLRGHVGDGRRCDEVCVVRQVASCFWNRERLICRTVVAAARRRRHAAVAPRQGIHRWHVSL